jgi:hypothetical protein
MVRLGELQILELNHNKINTIDDKAFEPLENLGVTTTSQ